MYAAEVKNSLKPLTISSCNDRADVLSGVVFDVCYHLNFYKLKHYFWFRNAKISHTLVSDFTQIVLYYFFSFG